MASRIQQEASRRKLAAIAAALLLLLGARSLQAAEGMGLSEGDFLGELPVVLSVSRLVQPTRDAPAAVTVIDAETIRASGARDLADLLRLVPGFTVTWGDLGSPMAVYHGYLPEDEPRRLQVLVDGRSQYSPAFIGAVNWNIVDVQLADIERIEVIRGTNAASYGSNAFLGVVNVITRNAASAQGVDLFAASGAGGVNDRSVRAGLPVGDGFARLSAERRQDVGLPTKHYDGRQTDRAHLRVDYPLGRQDNIEFSAGTTRVDLGLQGSPNQLPPDRSRGYSTEHAQGIWRHAFDAGAESQVRVLRAVDRSDDTVFLTNGVVSTLFDHTLKTTRDEVEAQYLWTVGTLRSVVGTSYRNDSTRSSQFFGDGRKVWQTIWRGFGSTEWQPVRWLSAQAATTWERDSISGTNWSPRLMVNVKPVQGHTVRVGAARSHRVPTIFEEYAHEDYRDIGPNNLGLIDSATRSSGGLRPETLDSYELGYLLENAADRFTLDLRAFDERIDDAILWYQVPLSEPQLLDAQTRDFTNAGRTRIRGVEYQARWQPVESTRITFNQTLQDVSSVITRSDIPDFGLTSNAAGRLQYLQEAAPRRMQSLIVQKSMGPRIDLFFAWHYVGPHKTTPGLNQIDEYRRFDWRIAYRFRVGGSEGELAYTVQSDGRPHVERKGGAERINDGSADFINPRGWLSARLTF